MSDKSSSAFQTVRPFLVGGTSACFATCCIQPIDMVKVRIQLSGEGGAGAKTNPISVASQMIKKDGFFSLYRGLSAGITRQMSYGMTRLGVFRTLSNKYIPEGGTAADIPFLTKVKCSMIAGGTGALIGTPADAALVRMQADTLLPPEQQRGYKNAIDALTKMAKQEGMKGFFSGATPTIARGLSINVGMLTTYDMYKKWNSSWAGDGTQLNRFFSGALSGWTAATVSLPFDFVKTRLQKQQPKADGTVHYKNLVDCFAKVAREEGAMAFYNGYATYVARITPHIMITWVAMDFLNDTLKSRGY